MAALDADVLRWARDAGANVTKTSLMVGCGETADEVLDAMRDLREAEVDVLTIGQYLRPTQQARPGRALRRARGVRQLPTAPAWRSASSTWRRGPLVRSSYRAAEAFLTASCGDTTRPISDRYGKRRLEIVS